MFNHFQIAFPCLSVLSYLSVRTHEDKPESMCVSEYFQCWKCRCLAKETGTHSQGAVHVLDPEIKKKKAEGINQIGYGRAKPLSVAQCQSTADHLKCEQDTAVPVSFR